MKVKDEDTILAERDRKWMLIGVRELEGAYKSNVLDSIFYVTVLSSGCPLKSSGSFEKEHDAWREFLV